jgi:DNA polymerase V
MKAAHPTIELHPVDPQTDISLPYASGGIKAGFPSPAQDLMDTAIDLNKELIHNQASTFFGRVKGDSMCDAGLEDGDILIIDKAPEPQNGDMAVCYIDGEFTLKYIRIEKEVVWLVPANEAYQPIKVTAENDFLIWGIVTYSIRNHKRRKRK